MDLENAITVIVTCPFMIGMRDGGMDAKHMVVTVGFISVGGRLLTGEAVDMCGQSLSGGVKGDSQADLATFMLNVAYDRRPVTGVGPPPPSLVGPHAGWIVWVAVGLTFSPAF